MLDQGLFDALCPGGKVSGQLKLVGYEMEQRRRLRFQLDQSRNAGLPNITVTLKENNSAIIWLKDHLADGITLTNFFQ